MKFRCVLAGLTAFLVTSCLQPDYPVVRMDAAQIRNASDDSICGTMACSATITRSMQDEMARRYPNGLKACFNISYDCTRGDPSIRSAGSTVSVASQGGLSSTPSSNRPAPPPRTMAQAPRAAAPVPAQPSANGLPPACDGLSIVDVGIGNYNGVPGVVGVYMKVNTTSNQRKWIQADVKYASETHTALQHTANQYWDTTKPLILRPGDGTDTFWIRSLVGTGESNIRIADVRVVACGT